jgi:hypothetical protein
MFTIFIVVNGYGADLLKLKPQVIIPEKSDLSLPLTSIKSKPQRKVVLFSNAV